MKKIDVVRLPWYRRIKRKPLTAEEMARAFAQERKRVPPSVQATETMAGESSSRREEIARGKRPVRAVDEEPIQPVVKDASGKGKNVAEPVIRDVVKKSKARKLPPPDELISILMSMAFKGTRYPHKETMMDLGICRDVEYLLDMCHLGTLMSFQFEAHQEETCHFLATLAVHFYDDFDPEDEDGPGLGYITFSVRGEEHSITIKELDTMFSFPNGTMVDSEVDEDELKDLWLTIAGPSEYASGRSKSSAIRSPVLRYVHRAIASTFYARKIIGNVNEPELEMLDWALTGLLSHTRTGRALAGNQIDTSLTCMLLDHLLSYREWAFKVHRLKKKGELSIGGIVTPILAACGLALDGDAVEPRWIDMQHLVKCEFLARERVNGQYLYKFFHPRAHCTKMMPLPCPAHTTIRLGGNIDFSPPTMLLYPKEAQDAEQEETAQYRADQYRPEEVDPEETEQYRPSQVDAEQVDPEEDDLPGSPLEEFKGRSLQDAHRHIGRLRRWSIKTIKALQKTVSVMGNQIKDLQGKSRPVPSPGPVTGINILRRSGSTSIAPRRNIFTEPPRASSFEPRERVQPQDPRHWQFQSPSSMSQANLHPEPSTALVPVYTRESMEAAIDSYFI